MKCIVSLLKMLFSFESWSPWVDQAGLELIEVHLPLPLSIRLKAVCRYVLPLTDDWIVNSNGMLQKYYSCKIDDFTQINL